LAVLVLQVHDHGDTGEVEPGLEQVADAPNSVQVVGAVAAGAASGALGIEQPAGLIQPQRLHPHADQLGGDRDAVHAARVIGSGCSHRQRPYANLCVGLLHHHGTSAI
jgi:hypothetical protein